MYLHGAMDYGKTLKLRVRVGDLDLPGRRKMYSTSSRVELEEDAQSCPRGNADESRTHMAVDCELYKEERKMLEEEMKKMDGCGMEKFGALDGSEKNDRYTRRQLMATDGGAPSERDSWSMMK